MRNLKKTIDILHIVSEVASYQFAFSISLHLRKWKQWIALDKFHAFDCSFVE
jgi:hypothetical protein